MDEKFLNKHRSKMGIEGSWNSYFTLLKDAFEKKNIVLISEIDDDHDNEELIILKIHYPIMVGARIAGSFNLTNHEVKGNSRQKIIAEILFKMIDKIGKDGIAEKGAKPKL